MSKSDSHPPECECDDCRQAWEQWMMEQEERAAQERWNRYAEDFYRQHPHG